MRRPILIEQNLFHHRQKHFKSLFGKQGMWIIGRHQQELLRLDQMNFARDNNLCLTINNINQCT